jgi:putative transposase
MFIRHRQTMRFRVILKLRLTGEGARPTQARIHLHAVVIMPDHVHMLLAPHRDEDGWPFPLVDILQCTKSATAHRINKLLHTSGPISEEESFDHVLRSDESLQEKCEYIRQNPVEAGLVENPNEYRWLWIDPRLAS